MASISKCNEVVFVKNYYNALCNKPSMIQNYYVDGSKLTICKETESPDECTEGFMKYIKSKIEGVLTKVLVSHVSHQKIDEERSIVNVVGQFVYGDKTQSRVSHQFIIMKIDGTVYIKNEILTFLNEDVVYETGEGRDIVVECEKDNVVEGIAMVYGMAGIESVRIGNDGKLSIVLGSEDDVSIIKKNALDFTEKGFGLKFALSEGKEDE
ncbi:nuclear transport factor 2 [Ordospora colligata]|uniref:Nuclear transport factor 2 n=1 Tax=Ordospora colligata OC4 TaxID=1354746 RepID=A0A0B2UMW3_9MICR|nr:nuclear transport factor 2 [Ordospora colligata OC4]KHN70275.1 nuclear transport factor 2 [Ordospora colligata OC4]TBU16819.1 nuclear transport factor 2 [Ordospora colligata]TBU16927.1 nuclear transport factor 2 [Ordospora colligata]TBU19368.1 nuclear transport factor 2 [Ordospora colligata]